MSLSTVPIMFVQYFLTVMGSDVAFNFPLYARVHVTFKSFNHILLFAYLNRPTV